MLRLTKLTDYAIVILTYFAHAPEVEGDSPVFTARGLAESSRLPLPTVSKILKLLSRSGLLVSHRGVAGGYSLSRDARSISVADVIAAIDGPIALTECVDNEVASNCELEATCPCRSNWQRINSAVRGALQKLSIADMTAPMPGALVQHRTPHRQPELVTLSARKS